MSLFTQLLDRRLQGSFAIDTLTTCSGSPLDIILFEHASIALSDANSIIYIDPISSHAPDARLPKATLIAITHSHYDHLDLTAVDLLSGGATTIIADHTSATKIGFGARAVAPNQTLTIDRVGDVEVVAAYNITPEHLQFHPRERGDCGYIFSLGGSRIYIAGDSEPTPEMLGLHDIDVAFLPVNQPYTMTEEQAADAAKSLSPAILYPYHFGGGDRKTNLDALCARVEGCGIDVRIRDLA